MSSTVDIVKNSNSFSQVFIFCLEVFRRNNNAPMRTEELIKAIALLDLKGFKLGSSVCNGLFVNHAMFVNGCDIIVTVENDPRANHLFKIDDQEFEMVCKRNAKPDFWGPCIYK